MALRVTMATHALVVQSGTVGDPGDVKFKNESAFWYALQHHLRDNPPPSLTERFGKLDLIKKQAYKDPYWLGPGPGVYYLLDRKRRFFLYDNFYQVRDLAEDFNKAQHVSLRVHYLVD